MSRSTAALALCAGLMAAEPVDASLAGLGDPPVECLALYALLALAAPPFAPDANARRTLLVKRTLAGEPDGSELSPHGRSAALDSATEAEVRRRAAPLIAAETDAEVRLETDALLAGIRSCDRRHGFSLTPVPWID